MGNKGQGNLPSVSWATTGNTGEHIPVYAWGDPDKLLQGVMDNTDLFGVVTIGAGPTPPDGEPQGNRSGGEGGCVMTSVACGSYTELIQSESWQALWPVRCRRTSTKP